MIKGIEGIPRQDLSISSAGQSSVNKSTPVSFAEFLKANLSEANSQGIESDRAIESSLKGTQVNPQETIMALQKADVSFRLMLNIKDKIEQAYQTVVRTQIG